MDKNKKKLNGLLVRARRVRAKVSGTAERPRLSVFRSNTSLYLQLIDDVAGRTVLAAHSREVKGAKEEGLGTKEAEAMALGRLLAEKAKDKGLTSAVFDRAGYRYHGRVKAAAEGARAGGLVF
jgi:large subunit ribosomal protein L18